MIKLVIFDLDGVLVEARGIHYHALNRALDEVAEEWIHPGEHVAKFDGLPTRKKLAMLTEEGRLDPALHDKVWRAKQSHTLAVIKEEINPEDHKDLIEMLLRLQSRCLTVYCASNSIRETGMAMLRAAGYCPYIQRYFCNEDVEQPKPHGEMYMRAMLLAGVNATETLIVEDSHIGRQAAYNSGAHVLGVAGTHDLSLSKVEDAIAKYEEKPIRPKWQGGKMNVLIPMAGAGSRFEKAGYTFPKPLIEVHGKPMIQTVVENLNIDAHHIFIVQEKHYHQYNLQTVLSLISPDCEIVRVRDVTEGAACTTLLARSLINNDAPLLIANSDQWIQWDSNEFMYAVSNSEIDGGILTFKSIHPKWSFAKTNSEGYVTEVAEKNPISDNATVGVYYWARGSDYVKYAERMVCLDKRVNGEFYVCPVFNEAIADGKKFRIFPIEKMWGLGTPEDLDTFLKEREHVA